MLLQVVFVVFFMDLTLHVLECVVRLAPSRSRGPGVTIVLVEHGFQFQSKQNPKPDNFLNSI